MSPLATGDILTEKDFASGVSEAAFFLSATSRLKNQPIERSIYLPSCTCCKRHQVVLRLEGVELKEWLRFNDAEESWTISETRFRHVRLRRPATLIGAEPISFLHQPCHPRHARLVSVICMGTCKLIRMETENPRHHLSDD